MGVTTGKTGESIVSPSSKACTSYILVMGLFQLFNGGQWGKISLCTCLRARSINEEVFALIRAKNWGVSGTLSSTFGILQEFMEQTASTIDLCLSIALYW